MQPGPNKASVCRWECLVVLLVIIAISILFSVGSVFAFYLEENWRGASEWSKTKAEVEAQGESLDPKDYIPTSISEEANFGSLPIFKTTPQPDHPEIQLPTALSAALEPLKSHLATSKEDETPDKLPYLDKWTTGKKPDLSFIRSRLAEISRQTDPPVSVTANASPTEQLELLCPALSGLRAENLTHPDCVFAFNYNVQPPANLSFGPITVFIKMTQILIYEERLALYENKSELAIDDMAVTWKVFAGLRKQPLLISALVGNAVPAMQLTVIQQGLYDHIWNDHQLAAIDRELGKLDILANARFAIAGDIVVFDLPVSSYYESHRFITPAEFSMLQGKIALPPFPPAYLGRIIFWLTPKGWFDMENALDVRYRLLGTINVIDPVSRRVFPDKEKTLLQEYSGVYSPVFRNKPFLDPDSMMTRSVKTFAYNQALIDEARIACRLERYRLLYGSYPDSLNALVPAFGSELPRDIMTGDSYLYKLHADGTFLLYSAGWDQDDNGGQTTITAAETPRDAPDWVWANHIDAEKTK